MVVENTNIETLLHYAASFRKAYVKACSRLQECHDLSPSEIEILVFLSNNKHINTAKELSIYLQQSKGLVCRSVERLQARGFLQIEEDVTDRRIRHLLLKEDSDGVVKTIKNNQKKFTEVLMAGVHADEWAQMISVLSKIDTNLNCFLEGNEWK